VTLYVCYGTWKPAPWRAGGKHPCGVAYGALKDAGHDPEVERVYGLGPLPGFLNVTRREIKRLTGNYWVPVLLADDGEVVQGSRRIIEWAQAHPAPVTSATAAAD
jgi:hypothetical protein